MDICTVIINTYKEINYSFDLLLVLIYLYDIDYLILKFRINKLIYIIIKKKKKRTNN